MNHIIRLIEEWMDNGLITEKDINIRNSDFNVHVKSKNGINVEFNFHIGKDRNAGDKEFLTFINNLTTYYVESNIPF